MVTLGPALPGRRGTPPTALPCPDHSGCDDRPQVARRARLRAGFWPLAESHAEAFAGMVNVHGGIPH